MMVRGGAERPKAHDHVSRRCFHTSVCRIADDPDAAIDRNGGCSPSPFPIPPEPLVRRLVLRVGRVEKRGKNVDVEKRYAHSSSRSRFTNARSGFDAPDFGTNNGTPLRTRGASLGSKP
jgi:hypothetical protein